MCTALEMAERVQVVADEKPAENADEKLLQGVELGLPDLVHVALNLGANANLQLGACSILHLGVRNGCFAIVQSLVLRGANVNQLSSEGVTPLMVAACKGRLACANFLL